MCEKAIEKEIPIISVQQRDERKKIMADLEKLHIEVMQFLDNITKEYI